MTSFPIAAGPFYALTVNSSSVSNIRTGGTVIHEETPSTYMPCLGNSCMTGWHKVSFSLTFYNPSELILNLARGQVINTSLNNPPDQQLYRLSLYGLSRSFTFPSIRTEKILDINYNKDRVTQVTVQFVVENRSPDVDLIEYDPT